MNKRKKEGMFEGGKKKRGEEWHGNDNTTREGEREKNVKDVRQTLGIVFTTGYHSRPFGRPYRIHSSSSRHVIYTHGLPLSLSCLYT